MNRKQINDLIPQTSSGNGLLSLMVLLIAMGFLVNAVIQNLKWALVFLTASVIVFISVNVLKLKGRDKDFTMALSLAFFASAVVGALLAFLANK